MGELLGFSGSRWGSNQVSLLSHCCQPSSSNNSNRLLVTTSPVHQNKTPQQEKKSPAVGPASRDNRHYNTSKETHPNHDPDPTQRQDGNVVFVSPRLKRQCKSTPTRSDRPFPLSLTNDSSGDASVGDSANRSSSSPSWACRNSGSCHHHGSKPAQHKPKRTRIRIKSEANSGAVWMPSLVIICQVELE